MSVEHEEISNLKKTVEQHSIILKGDDSAYPPKPGVMTVLKQISDQLSHPESGNAALYQSVRDMRAEDMRRVSWFGGARWVITLLIGFAGFVIGLIVKVKFGG